MTATFCLNNFYYWFLISGILFSILYIFFIRSTASFAFSLSLACIYAITSPVYTLSPAFFSNTIPTVLSISSSFFIRPAPKNTDNLPICSASILVIYPSFSHITEITYFDFSYFSGSSIYKTSPF